MGAALATGGGGKKRKGATPDINITPLVDVTLVLLVFFILTTTNMSKCLHRI